MKATEFVSEKWSQKYKSSINCARPRGFSQKAHCAGRNKTEDVEEGKRIARKPGQPAGSKKHSDLYTDENPKGTITGLKFATVADARASVSKIRNSDRSHAHKIQAAVAMEQRARAAGKSEEAAVYRGYINANKKTDESIDLEEDLRDWFGTGKGGGAGGGGWDRYNTKGERIGKCGDRKPGEGKPKCLSKSRAASLRASGGKKAIASAVRRKRAKDTNPERSGAARNVPNKNQNEDKDLETAFLQKQIRARYPQAKDLESAMALDYFKSQRQDRRDIGRLDQENDSEQEDIARLDRENDSEEQQIDQLQQELDKLKRLAGYKGM